MWLAYDETSALQWPALSPPYPHELGRKHAEHGAWADTGAPPTDDDNTEWMRDAWYLTILDPPDGA